MKVVLQRVSRAAVDVDGERVGEIGRGLLLLSAVGLNDTENELKTAAQKLLNLRIFPDDAGRFQHSVLDINGSVLLVPQFTLYADLSKGRRPDFFGAMKPPAAAELFARFCDFFRVPGIEKVAAGVFGAHMEVSLINDGPVTIVYE